MAKQHDEVRKTFAENVLLECRLAEAGLAEVDPGDAEILVEWAGKMLEAR